MDASLLFLFSAMERIVQRLCDSGGLRRGSYLPSCVFLCGSWSYRSITLQYSPYQDDQSSKKLLMSAVSSEDHLYQPLIVTHLSLTGTGRKRIVPLLTLKLNKPDVAKALFENLRNLIEIF